MTSTFRRTFDIDKLTDEVLDENGWLRHLLCHWRPAGATSTSVKGSSADHLRVAIRDGYLNFYRGGQSVANVGFDRHGKPRAKVHNKYVYGDKGAGDSYVTLTSAGYREGLGDARLVPCSATALLEWISQANRYGGKEKKFVDSIVGHNPNVIDMEMGLPAYSGAPTAPRMDLVALERTENGWRVVFWEAKLVTNGEARSSGDSDPKVTQQLEKYTKWLSHEGHEDLVKRAYQNTCRLLVDLHALAKRFRPDVEDLGSGVREVAALDWQSLLIDREPRLLIDASKGDGAFTKNRHLAKLQKKKLFVQMVEGPSQTLLKALP